MKANGNKFHPLSHYPDMEKYGSLSPEKDQQFSEKDQHLSQSLHTDVRMKEYGPFSPETDQHIASHDLIGRLDKIEAWMENQNGFSKSLKANASSTHLLIQDLCLQVDRISERLEPHWSKEAKSAPSTPVKEAAFPPPSPSGGASSTAEPTSSRLQPKHKWYCIRRGLGNVRMITDDWNVAEKYTKNPGEKDFARGIEIKGFATYAECVKWM